MHLVLIVLTVLVAAACGQQPSTNLPDVPQGFNASARIEIKAPKEVVWRALLDFPNYPRWNPFVRSSVIVDDSGNPLPASAQVAQTNRTVHLRVQLPPLPMPVNESTPEIWLNTQTADVNITDLMPEQGRVAWVSIDRPAVIVTSKRWNTVTGIGDNTTLYESREVFHGAAVPILELVMSSKLNAGFNAQAQALKLWCENGQR